MSKAYWSNAKWSKIGKSFDKHCNSDDPEKNKEFAFAICSALKSRWGHHKPPCEIRGTCLEVWVTDDKDNIIK